MTKQIKLPCGLNKDGKLIYIDEAKNGLACECMCPACKQPLVAKNGGNKREHHFAHLNVVECEHGYQSALHYMGKDCFLELEYLTFVKNGVAVRYKIDSVVLEQKVDDIIPDILVTCDGKRFIVEIYVTHAVDDAKKQKIKDLQISAVEIDLSRFQHEMIDKESLKQELCNISNFSWVYDADIDLIEQKRKIIQQFGLIRPLQLGDAIECPMLVKQANKFHRFVPLSYCLKCPHCALDNQKKFIHCGKLIHAPVNLKLRQKLFDDVFVNDNKVLFASEFKQYQENFRKNLKNAVILQFRIFQNISLRLTIPYSSIAYGQSMLQSSYKPQRRYHSHWRRRKR